MNGQTLSNLRQIRQSLGYKQFHIAKKLGISQTAYSNWENGKTELTADKKSALANLYNRTWQEIETHHEYLNKKNSPYTILENKLKNMETELFLIKNTIAQFIQRGGVTNNKRTFFKCLGKIKIILKVTPLVFIKNL